MSDTLIQQDLSKFQTAIAFHGHLCPGLTLGYRAAQIALEQLDSVRAPDEEMVCIVENDACGLDAIQVMTGCTIGKGNLILQNHGKQVYTFIDRKSGKGVRLALRPESDISHTDPRLDELRPKVMGGSATPDEQAEFHTRMTAVSDHLASMPAGELFTIREGAFEIPEKARIFNTVVCASCGEPVSEGMARLKDGRPICLPCHHEYTRGW
jgi:formylmethanofuran dehydrogenase subunit E